MAARLKRFFNRYSIALIVYCCFYFILYNYKLTTSHWYHPDFSRDLYEILKITRGDFTLLGPKLTFGGLYTGPYQFYLFAPIFWLTNANINALLSFNVLLFVAALGYFTLKSYQKYGLIKSVVASLSIGLLPLYIFASRDPSNAYTYIPFLFFLLTYIYFTDSYKWYVLIGLGFIMGVISNFHFVNFVLLPPIILILIYYTRDFKKIILFLTGFVVAFFPLILFEVTHRFIMFTNTFIQKSYKAWIENKNIPGGLTGKKNVFANIIYMSEQMKKQTLFNPLIAYAFLTPYLWIIKTHVKNKIFLIAALSSLFLFASIIRFQFIPHYLFSVAFFLMFTLVILLLNSRFTFLFIIFVLAELFTFPTNLYQPAYRNPQKFEKAATYIHEHNLIQKNESFNVLQITKENLLAPIGFEYRFFLLKNGYNPDSEFLYNTSQSLLIFSEIPEYDINKFSSWEADQFGKDNFKKAKKYFDGTTTIYKVVK